MTRTGRPARLSATGPSATSGVTSCPTAHTARARKPRRPAVRVAVAAASLALASVTTTVVTTPAVAATWPGETAPLASAPTLPGLAAEPSSVTPEGVVLPGRPTSTDALVAPTKGSWPLSPAPTVLRDFEAPAARWAAGHRGVDLAGRPGQRVRAAVAGTVTFAGRIAGRGVVVVSHGAARTTYEPVAASVTVGDQVTRGAPIGTLELLGSHCLPRACLHWGLLEGEAYLDPLRLLGLAPVRLLPWSGALP